MYYIYKFTNKLNQKVYIGQTNNIENRKRNHKSESFNPKANGYNLPFHIAIRKYGWENFDFEILEEISDNFNIDYVNEREIYFIKKYDSQVKANKGYNVTLGGAGFSRSKLAFEEQVGLSKLFSIEEVKDIQQMLIDGYQYFEIKNKYGNLTNSFLTNINIGDNFYRKDLQYPLSTFHSKFSKKTQENIINDIIIKMDYKTISEKYGISQGYISMINNGTKWHNDKYEYPLCKKSCADGAWSHEAKYLLIFTEKAHLEIASKLGKAKSAITALNAGRNRKDNRFIYPLRSNQIENQKIWNTLF